MYLQTHHFIQTHRHTDIQTRASSFRFTNPQCVGFDKTLFKHFFFRNCSCILKSVPDKRLVCSSTFSRTFYVLNLIPIGRGCSLCIFLFFCRPFQYVDLLLWFPILPRKTYRIELFVCHEFALLPLRLFFLRRRYCNQCSTKSSSDCLDSP